MSSDIKDQLNQSDKDFIDGQLKLLESNNVKTSVPTIETPSEVDSYSEWFIMESKWQGGENEMITPINDYGEYKIPAGTSGTFLKMESGDNRIRILTKASEVRYHETGSETEYKTVSCTGKDCDLCKKGNISKIKYAFLVLKKNADGNNTVHVYEAPITVFRQIVAYDLNEEYGDVRDYDLTIKKEGEKKTTVYTVIASPKKVKLTDEESQMILDSGVTLEKAYEAKL